MVELLEKGRINTEIIPLKPLREVRVVKGSLDEVLDKASDDYVTVILTDEAADTDTGDRIRDKFPNLLEIRKEVVIRREYEALTKISDELSEIDNCRIFLNELNDKEESILTDIINGLKGV